MWAIRILTGAQAGQIFPLQEGKSTFGRGSTCEIKIASNSVSKEHATVLVIADKVILSDLNSRNGTFVNGVRIQNQRLNVNDKIAFHDILLEVIEAPASNTQAFGRSNVPAMPSWAGANALHLQPQSQGQPFASNDPFGGQAYQAQGLGQIGAVPAPPPPAPPTNLMGSIQAYVDTVAMPGIYALAKTMPYRWAIGLLVALYIVAVTAISIVPIVAMTKKNIQAESIRRAKTIARNMRDTNKRAILDRDEAKMDIRAAELEEGVTGAYIINGKDGTIMSPASKRGEYVNKPFVNRARQEEREFAEFINDSNLGVSVPVTGYSAETDRQSVAAFAIVLYDVGALAMTPQQTFSLFIQTLTIALLAGMFLFFFLYKLVENPVEIASLELDDALREGRDDLKTEYQFPALERMLQNVNSALSRIGQAGSGSQNQMVAHVNRDVEATNVVRMLSVPAVTVNAVDERVIATNRAFDKLVGGGVQLTGRPLRDIPDVALQQNLLEMLPRMRQSVAEIALSEIPFSGQSYEICGQAVMGASEPAYFLITLSQPGGE